MSSAAAAQARYERALLVEITKLQAALTHERDIMAAQQAQFDSVQRNEMERKVSESEKASRLQAMEKAIESAQKQEQKEFLRKVT